MSSFLSLLRILISNVLRLLIVLLITASFTCAATLPTINANDNRSPAGELRGGVLTLRLEIGEGQWHPEREDGDALTVYAFGETGRPLQNPGPLIRVPQGTEIHVIAHNALAVAAALHGLHEKPGKDEDALLVQPDATRDFRFQAGAPGAYYYWATTTGNPLVRRTPIETQLAGAIVIDPPGVVASDRVFVIGVWYKQAPIKIDTPQAATINGKAWPYSERFTFQVGETVRWRWLNPSFTDHAMHLHGFYYDIASSGDGEQVETYSEAERPRIVTRWVDGGKTFDMTWVPERAGRWLFHCHMMIHMSPSPWHLASDVPTSTVQPAMLHSHSDVEETDRAGMAGLVLGITVAGKKEAPPSAAWHAERNLQLNITERKPGERPLYALDVRDPASLSSGNAAPDLLGPPIVLTRGQPVEIEVVNHLKQPTAIHWHGIELESYYDGVAGWTGSTQQTTPPIPPGGSFVARMTPPRAGTFIYHTHWHEHAQLENGIYGPLIVLPSGQKFDPVTDKTFLFSQGVFEPFGPMLLINGRPQSVSLKLATGTKYRFRLINISLNYARMRASLRQAGMPVQWRIIAKDGADLPPASATMQAADLTITVGETYDFEYEAASPQELTLESYLPGLKVRTTQVLVFAAAE